MSSIYLFLSAYALKAVKHNINKNVRVCYASKFYSDKNDTPPSSGGTGKRSPESNGVASDDGGPTEIKRVRTGTEDKTGSQEYHAADAPLPNTGRGYFQAHSMVTSDPFRSKAREMLQTALECGSMC